jgi:hypothetical protein
MFSHVVNDLMVSDETCFRKHCLIILLCPRQMALSGAHCDGASHCCTTQWEQHEQVFLVKMYWIVGSPNVTQKEFKKHFRGRDDPSETIICGLEEKGSLVDEHCKHQLPIAVHMKLLAFFQEIVM